MNDNTSTHFPGVSLVEDPNDGGAILGLSKYLCPNCDAHLAKSGLCLNACHLGEKGKARFIAIMLGYVENQI